MALYTVYKLGDNEYVGSTSLSLEDKYLEWDKGSKPVFLQNNPHLNGIRPTALHQRKLQQKVALALEVYYTISLGARGGPYANKHLTREQKAEVRLLKQALDECGSTVHDRVKAVARVSGKCRKHGPLYCHLRNLCYYCNEQYGPSCACKRPVRIPDRNPVVKRKRQSGKNPRTGAARLKDLGYPPGSKEYKDFKLGPGEQHQKEARRKDNKRQPHRGSGKRR